MLHMINKAALSYKFVLNYVNENGHHQQNLLRKKTYIREEKKYSMHHILRLYWDKATSLTISVLRCIFKASLASTLPTTPTI